jgi:hypothetical protein
MSNIRNAALGAALGLTFAGGATAADLDKIDWNAVPKNEVMLFFPGQASYQWLKSSAHAGAQAVDKMECLACHKGAAAKLGDRIVSGKALEPHVIPGKRGTLPLTLQAAYDNEYLYLKASWPSKEPGVFHEYVVYRNGKWEEYGSHRGKPAVLSGKTKASYEDRFSIMLGEDSKVENFGKSGCWVTCHNDMRYMPNHPKADEVVGHPLLGKDGLKRTDVRKYLPASRTAMGPTGGWDKTKSRAELDAMKAQGNFLELWQWRANRSNFMRAADDGYVLEYRLFDSGKNPFFGTWDGGKSVPTFMFDPAKNNGRAALTEADFRSASAPRLTSENRVAYDPNYAWKDGDILYKFGQQKPEGSAADNEVVGTHANGAWTVSWKRKLATGNKDDIALADGATYPIGFAVHDDITTARWHYVSFPLTLGLGKGGTINATRLK